MSFSMNLKSIIALRHAYPIKYQQFLALLNHVKYLEDFVTLPLGLLTSIFKVNPLKMSKIIQDFQHLYTSNIIDYYNENKIHIIPIWTEYYPSKLLELYDPPIILFAKGNKSLLKNCQMVACIGSRNATEYSVEALKLILPPLVEKDIVIVSGLAKGADTLAHQATILYSGKTIAVLGHGLHLVYPKENLELANCIAKDHLLLTEFTLFEGPKKFRFPMRNRIISGLSDALIVTEAAEKSGTLITTEHALEHGKDVFVVPGPITSKLSEGTNRLIKEGAIPIWNGYQILEEIHAPIKKS